MYIGSLLLFCFLIISCTDAKAKPKSEYINAIKVGKTLDAQVIMGYNEPSKTEIRTEFGNIVIEGARSIILNQDAYVRTSDKGKEFCVGYDEECFKMY